MKINDENIPDTFAVVIVLPIVNSPPNWSYMELKSFPNVRKLHNKVVTILIPITFKFENIPLNLYSGLLTYLCNPLSSFQYFSPGITNWKNVFNL